MKGIFEFIGLLNDNSDTHSQSLSIIMSSRRMRFHIFRKVTLFQAAAQCYLEHIMKNSISAFILNDYRFVGRVRQSGTGHNSKRGLLKSKQVRMSN